MKLLRRVLMMPDKELGTYLITALKKSYKTVETDRNNYIYAPGENATCLVAHLDTCRNAMDEPVVLTKSRNVIRNIKGILGADDRAGIYGILEVIRHCKASDIPLPSVIFTNYEERGGAGVREFIKSQLFKPEGINLFIELDRKGCNEYVFYSHMLPKKVKDYVESFGFQENRGSYSDIADLTNEYEIPSVNLSVGYYQQHSAMEKLHYDELLLTIDRVCDMCADPIEVLHTVAKPIYKNYRKGYHHYEDDYGSFYGGPLTNTKPVVPSKGGNKSVAATTPAKAPAAASSPAKASAAVFTAGATATTTKVTPITKAAEKKAEVTSTPVVIYTDQDRQNVMNAFNNHKFEIKNALLFDSNLDKVCQLFYNQKYQSLAIEMLGDLENDYNAEVLNGMPANTAWVNSWNGLVKGVFHLTCANLH